MIRLRYTAAVAMLGAGLVSTVASAAPQSGQLPPLQPILSGKKFVPPVKGQADVEITKPVQKREKDMVVATIDVKNVSPAPIARLTVDETWYDKEGALVTGGKGQVGMLQPGEVQKITIETPYNAKMSRFQFQFTHANGSVKTHQVESLDTGDKDKKEPATKKTSRKK